MDSVSTFNVFVQVAEARSFVGAAKALGVSASAVGKSIVRLEERLGVRLFHRNTRSVTLTAEGTLFLARSRKILAEIEAAENELSQTSGNPRGRLKVSLPLVAEPFLPILADFRKAYTDIDLDLDFSDRRVDVVEEGFDAVVRSGDAADSQLTSRMLGAYRMLIVAAPEYLDKYGVPLHPHDLINHSCIQFRFPNTGKMQIWPFVIEGGSTDHHLPSAIICNNLEARICFATHAVGIAYLPDFAIGTLLANGKLVPLLNDYISGAGTFRIMWPSGRQPPPKLRVFIDFLTKRMFSS